MQSQVFKPAKYQKYFPHTTWHVPEDSEVISIVIPACELHQQTNNKAYWLCCITATKQVMTKPVVTPMNFMCLLSPNFA